MMSFLRSGLVALTAVLLSACNPQSGQPADTLVIDITAVAKALGRDEVMQQKLDSTRQQLNEQLASITTDLNTQLEERQAELGDEASEEDEKELQEFALKANETLKQSQLLARQKALAYRSSLIQDFHDEVRAEAAEIARQRQAATVMLANESTLWFDPEADITDEVIARLRARSVDGGGNSQESARGNPDTESKPEQGSAAE